jgi:DNA replication and repair protein RecF
MRFSSLRLTGFRNLIDAEIPVLSRNLFLVGENGQGKTNFLESVYFCSYASSFRGVKDNDLIKNENKDCSVIAKIEDSLNEKIIVKIENGKKTVQIDGKSADRRELLSITPSIVFCHEDMEFVSGTPEKRRWFFDQSLSLYDPMYLDDLQKFRRVLKIRNTVLKDGNTSMLDVLDPQMIQYGTRLMEKRQDAAKSFSQVFGPLYEKVSGIEGITVSYVPSWKEENADFLLQYLEDKRQSDIVMKTSLSGPHRDRYVFLRNGSEFSGKASTGQRRLLALLMRIAQAHRYTEVTGKTPILLLDDVLLELDPEKRQNFVSVMPEYSQAFFTFLPEEPYQRYQQDDTMVYHVKEGKLTLT